MKRLSRFCVLAAFLAAACAGCGDGSKPAEPKVSGGNADQNLKRAGNGAEGSGGKGPTGGGSHTSSSPN